MVTRCARVTSSCAALAGDGVGERDRDRSLAEARIELRELLRERRESAGRIPGRTRSARTRDRARAATRWRCSAPARAPAARRRPARPRACAAGSGARSAARRACRRSRRRRSPAGSRAPRARRRGRARRCSSCRTARGREASPGRRLRACAVSAGGMLAALERVVRHVAVEAVGVAGAALVHHHEVALAPDAGEGRKERRETVDRSLARPAGDEEERVGLRLGRDRGNDRDGEPDARAVRVVRVLGHRERAAARLGGDEAVEVGDAAGLERDQRLRLAASAGESSAPRTKAASSSAREWLRSLMRVLRILSHGTLHGGKALGAPALAATPPQQDYRHGARRDGE